MNTVNPWYREPWPWIIMSGPAAVIVAGVITTWIAFATSDGLVADDYYKRGLAVNAVLKREQTATQRGIQAQVKRAGFDVRLRLERGLDGGYAAALAPLAPGHWRAVIDDPRGEWRIVREFP